MESLLSQYGHFIVKVDFNSEPDKTFMSDFMELYNSKDLVKLPTYRKNPENHSSINFPCQQTMLFSR